MMMGLLLMLVGALIILRPMVVVFMAGAGLVFAGAAVIMIKLWLLRVQRWEHPSARRGFRRFFHHRFHQGSLNYCALAATALTQFPSGPPLITKQPESRTDSETRISLILPNFPNQFHSRQFAKLASAVNQRWRCFMNSPRQIFEQELTESTETTLKHLWVSLRSLCFLLFRVNVVL